jgi:uncharacterized membrane protein YhhN
VDRALITIMPKHSWIFLFAIILVAELFGILLGSTLIQQICKPLLMPVLAIHFISRSASKTWKEGKWVIPALFLSWLGDILLMFQDKDSLFFLAGLASFMLAHVCYIILFHSIRVREMIKSKILPVIVVVIYYSTLISFLSAYLGDMKLPVRIYGIVISIMLILAWHMWELKKNSAGKWMLVGAVLFVMSDSILAINKFYDSFELAGVAIMLTYGLAQLCIVEGSIKYLRR